MTRYIYGLKLTIWNETQKQLTLLFYHLLSKRPFYIINLDPMYENDEKQNKAWPKYTLLISHVSQVR